MDPRQRQGSDGADISGVDGDSFSAAGRGSTDPLSAGVLAYNPVDGFPDVDEAYDVPLDEEEVYRGIDVAPMPHLSAMPLDDAAFERLQDLQHASVQPPKLGQLHLFETLDVPKLEPLPPMPERDTSSMPPLRDEPSAIPSITKCPIKSYTTFKLSKDLSPTVVTDAVASVLERYNVSYKMLQKGLKLRGNIVPPSDQGTDCTIGYESMGSVSFVFQLFYSEDNEHLMGVFRRLCGDVIAFNDKYRVFMNALRETSLGNSIV